MQDDRRMASRIARQFAAASLLAILVLPTIGIQSIEASRADGEWMIKDVVLTIFDCGHLVCGRIVWLKDPARRPVQCGRTIVWGLVGQGPNEWTGGSILDPDTNTTYQLSAKLQADNTLYARVFKGLPVIGETEVLKRVNLWALADHC